MSQPADDVITNRLYVSRMDCHESMCHAEGKQSSAGFLFIIDLSTQMCK